MAARFSVRATHCDHGASQVEVEETIRRITAPLERSWRRLEKARKIALKVNIVWDADRIRFAAGRRQELVDDAVLRAVLGLLRERTNAELMVVDSTFHPNGPDANKDIHFLTLLQEFGAVYVESTDRPVEWFDVPGGGLLFGRYQLNPCFREADAVVSVAKMKSHNFMGITGSTKNLFGLCPISPESRPRSYYHHLVRLPFVLADLGRLLDPCLNIIDGLVGQSGREWGGEARITNTLIAGDNCIATDACQATIMGNDPQADWPTPPFRRDRNHLLIAAQGGFGAINLKEIDFQHDMAIPAGQFDSDATDPQETVSSWRRTTCEQALYYLDRKEEFVDRYPNHYLFLQDGNVVWHGPERPGYGSRRQMAGARKDSALWLKYIDPAEMERERFAVYEAERLAPVGKW